MDKFTIRRAQQSDVPVLRNMILELAEYEKLTDQVTATEEILTEWIFQREKAEVLMAEENGVPVGYAIYFHNFSSFVGRAGIFLEDLYVRPGARKKGYGKALIRKVAAVTKERGCARLEWNCLDWNQSSIDFYRSLGAIPLDAWTTYRLDGQDLIDLAAEN